MQFFTKKNFGLSSKCPPLGVLSLFYGYVECIIVEYDL